MSSPEPGGAAPPQARRGLGVFWRLPWLVQAAVVAASAGVILIRVDVTDSAQALRDADLRWAAFGVAFVPLTRLIDSARWRIYVRELGTVPFPTMLGAFLVGNLVNNVLPMRAGDVVKIQILANRTAMSRAGLAASRAVESVVDGMTFVGFLALSLALADIAVLPREVLWGLAGAVGAGFLAAVAAAYWLPRTLSSRWPFSLLPGPTARAIDDALPRLREGLATMRHPRDLALALGLNAASWLVQAVTLVLLGEALDLDLSLGAYLGIAVVANLVTILPITFENVGPYEVLMVEMLALQDIDPDRALAYAVATHAVSNAWVIALGLGAMVAMRLRPRDVLSLRTRDDSPA